MACPYYLPPPLRYPHCPFVSPIHELRIVLDVLSIVVWLVWVQGDLVTFPALNVKYTYHSIVLLPTTNFTLS